MKKALVVLLAAVMIFALAAPSFAIGFVDSKEISDVEDPGNGPGKRILPIDSDDLDEETKKKISDAIKELENLDDVEKLNDDIKEIIEEKFKGYDYDNIVVEDVFVVVIEDDVPRDADGKTDVNVDIHYGDNDPDPIFIYKGEDGLWHTVSPKDMIRRADNTFTIRLPGSAVVATLVMVNPVSKGGTTNKGDKTSPQTGAENNAMAIAAVSAICVAGVAVMFASKRKAENN